MLRLIALLSALPLFAADDANRIVKRFIAADNQNWERANQYTYVQHSDYFSFDKNG